MFLKLLVGACMPSPVDLPPYIIPYSPIDLYLYIYIYIQIYVHIYIYVYISPIASLGTVSFGPTQTEEAPSR